MSDDRKPEPGDWVRVYDDDEGGEVTDVKDGGVTYWDHDKGRSFTVPERIVLLVEHPAVDEAAGDILDILREYDPSWGVHDTWNLRRRIVREVMRSVRPDHPGLKRPGVTGAPQYPGKADVDSVAYASGGGFVSRGVDFEEVDE